MTKDFIDEEWHKYWGVNVHGVFSCTREALKLMEPQKAGKIINIASIAGIRGFSAFHPAYCATKGAVLPSTRSVALASRRNMPRSRSIWRPTSITSSGRRSVRMVE